MAGLTITPSPRDACCHVFSVHGGAALLAAVGPAAVGAHVADADAAGVPPHRAAAWSAALFAAVAPRRVLALAPLPGGAAAAPAAADGAALSLLQTAAAAAAAPPPAAPLLPPGPLLGGAPAAVMAHVRPSRGPQQQQRSHTREGTDACARCSRAVPTAPVRRGGPARAPVRARLRRARAGARGAGCCAGCCAGL